MLNVVLPVLNDHLVEAHVCDLPFASFFEHPGPQFASPLFKSFGDRFSLMNKLLSLRDFAFWSISSRSLKRRSFTIVGLCLGRFVSGLPIR